MIIVLAVIGFAGVLILLRFLLRDFFQFIRKKTSTFTLPDCFVDFGPYLVTVFFAAAFAFLGILFYKVGMAIFAYFLSDDLISFFVLLRGVFSLNSGIQHPFHLEHMLSGILLAQLLQFVAIYLVYHGMRKFMYMVNRSYESISYKESDILYFGFLSSIFFILVELIFYSQHIPTVSAIAHLTFLGFSKMSIIAFFLSISHVHLLSNSHYRNSIAEYVEMDDRVKKVIYTPSFVLILTYCLAILLHLPFYTGAQFLENNWVIVIIYVISCLTSYQMLRLLLSGTYNYLGVIMLAENSSALDFQGNLLKPDISKHFYRLLIGVALVFLLFKLRYFFFLTLSGLSLIFTFLSILIITYFIGLTISMLRVWWLNYANPKLDFGSIADYLLITGRLFVGSSKIMLGIVFLAFVFFSFFPKPFRYQSNKHVNAVADRNGQFLYIDRKPENPSIPIDCVELPSFLVKCLVLQEDRYFFDQGNWWPNRSNWHGFSMSMFYRYFSGGGGSNLTQQLIKNLAFSSVFPQDIQRKFAETITAYQLSIQSSEREILSAYMNEVGFNGGKGHSGIVTASLFTFGRAPDKLNNLEMLYLVETLKRGTDFKSSKGYIKYKDAFGHSGEIKSTLIRKAHSWYKKALISKGEFSVLQNNELRFLNHPYKTHCAPATHVFLKRELQEENRKPGIYPSSLSERNQRSISKAVDKFQKHFRSRNLDNEFDLCAAALVVEVKSGRIIGHYGGDGVSNLASFGNGYPVGSVIKPFIIIELLESGWNFNEVRLYDGKMRGRFTPMNFSGRYSNEYVGINKVLSSSLNAPVVNVREYAKPIEMIEHVEARFAAMDLPADRYLDLSNPKKSGEYEVNYPLGSRNMTVQNIAQMYQTLLNEGVYRKLSAISSGEQKTTSDQKLIYQASNAKAISKALTYAMEPGGTGTHFQYLLPKGRIYFAKTGTSDEARHGYTVLSDGNILVVTWISFCKEEDGRLECNKTPAIPYGSGAKSAGMLAAMIYASLVD